MKPLQFSPDRSKEAILQSSRPVESTALLTMPGVISIESSGLSRESLSRTGKNSPALACWPRSDSGLKDLKRILDALANLLREVRREKHSIRSVLLEGVFWRLLIIEAIIIVWSMTDLWITDEPTLGELFRHGLRLGILSTLALAFIVITLGNFLAKKIIAPMEKIAASNRELRSKEQTAMEISVSADAPKEIQEIIASRTHMLHSIFKVSDERLKMVQFLRDTFGRYYSDKILDEILDPKESQKLGGKRETLTMLMSDIRGFTTLSQSLPPEELVKLLNRYLGEMTEIILRYDGIIDEFIGDAILAFFGMNEHEKDHASRAAACAISMQNALIRLTQELEAEGYPRIEMGIGINTGSVVVGNIGSPKRMKFGIVGAAINATARIESNTIGGQILIGRSTYELIESQARTEFKYAFHAKGMKDPIEIYSLVGLDTSPPLQLERVSGPAASIEFPVEFDYWEVQEKEIIGDAMHGRARWANSQAFRAELQQEVRPMTNLRLRIKDDFKNHAFDDIYAKVVFDSTDTTYKVPILRITAMTPEDRDFMNELLDEATKQGTNLPKTEGQVES